jgi:parallel beta-helix repeat protein
VGSSYVLAQAPWSNEGGGRQHIIAWSGSSLSNVLDGSHVMVSAAKYGTNTWVDMWPIGFTDNDGKSYLFFTSERKDPGEEGTGNIWYLPVTWDVTNDHYTYTQNAIDAATSTTINVAAGTYNENILVNKAVSLVGADRAVTIIDGNNAGNTVTITASDVSLSGFTVSGGYSGGGNIWHPYGGVVVDGNGGASALTNVTLNDNIIDGNSGNGVYVSAAGHGGPADNIAITNCTISNNGSDAPFFGGISLTYGWFDGGGTCDLGPGEAYDEWRRPKNVLIEGNDIVNAPTTGYVYGVYVNAGQNNTLRSNEIHGFSAKGLLIAASMPCTAIPCEYTTVQSNAIYDNAQNGVKLVSWNHHNTFVGNEIYNNGHGYTGAKDVRRYGFNFKDGDHNTLENNVIYGNKLGGLYLWGNGDPSYTWYSTDDNTITGNTISGHVAPNAHGIYIPARSGYPNGGFLNSTIAYNNITNNTYGLESADATQTVIAEYNWWGTPFGPNGENPAGKPVKGSDNVLGEVDYVPWLKKPFQANQDHGGNPQLNE